MLKQVLENNEDLWGLEKKKPIKTMQYEQTINDSDQYRQNAHLSQKKVDGTSKTCTL